MSPLVISLVVSACLGALIGLIRQWSDQTTPSRDVDLGGVRTYTFWAMLGCLSAFASRDQFAPLFAITLVLVGTHQIISLARTAAPQRPGGTTFASGLLTVFVGGLVFWEYRQIAIIVAATTMVMLGLKQSLHSWTRAFTPADIRATLQFVAISGVILPLVPNRDLGPYGAFNPYSTWLMVVLISGVGFAGYIAVRAVGASAGTFLTSLLGGIASSTATTLTFSRRSKEDPAQSADYSLAVITACSVMLPRVFIMVSLLSPELGVTLVVPFAAMLVPGAVYALWFWLARRRDQADHAVSSPSLANPLNLKTAVKFALLYAIIAFLVKVVTQLGSHSGLLPLSFISGLTDMDAISLTMARNEASAAVPLQLATDAIVLAAIANSLLKAGLAISLGSAQLRRRIAVVLGFTAATGAVSLLLMR